MREHVLGEAASTERLEPESLLETSMQGPPNGATLQK